MKEPLFPIAILAGGIATRLRPLTEKIPKALVEVQDEPFVAHQLRLLRQRGATRVIFCTGYKGEMLEDYLGNGSGFDVQASYSHDGAVLLGTAGAIKKALPLLGDTFFVLYGDSYLPCDYAAIQRAFIASGKSALMTVFKNDDQFDSSNVEFRDGTLVAYDKQNRTSRMRHIDYGIGVFRASAFDGTPEGVPSDLVLVYQHLLRENDLAAFEVKERFYEIGSFKGLSDFDEYLKAKNRT